MATRISPGDEAPNFDLASTEDAVLMLEDELIRRAVLLYFFPRECGERVRDQLSGLAEASESLLRQGAKILALSPMKLPDLKSLQRELGLPFPLLRDDRSFSAHYGIEFEEESGENPGGGIVLVDSDRRVLWAELEVESIGKALPEVETSLQQAKASTFNYPRSVLNRFVEWRVR